MKFNDGSEKLVYYGGLGTRQSEAGDAGIIPELGDELTITEIDFMEDESYMVSFAELKLDGVKVKYDMEFFVSKRYWDMADAPVRQLMIDARVRPTSDYLLRHPKCVCFVASEEDKEAGKCEHCGGSL